MTCSEFPPQAWDAYKRHRDEIEALLDPRFYTIAWLDAQIVQSRAMCFGNGASVIVIELKVYPTGAVELHGLVAAGELQGIVSLIGEAEDWAKGHGILTASIASRPGWTRVLKDKGYAVHQVVVRKELS